MAKFEQSHPVEDSASMNGIGATGGTGAPGSMPSTAPASPPLPPSIPPTGEYASEEDDPMRHMLMHFQGATGAMGGTPEPNVKMQSGTPIPQETLVRVAENTTGQIEKLSKEETLRQLKSQHLEAGRIFSAARSKMINIGYLIGCLLAHYKKLVIKDGENWAEAIKNNLPEMSRRTIDKYLNLASTPGILNHAHLGIDAAEQVIQTIAPLKSFLSKDDPIGHLFEMHGMPLNYDQMEKGNLKHVVRGVLTRIKLQRKEIEITAKIATDFSRLAGAVTAVDIAVMLDRQEHGGSPEKYMEEVIANNGTRPNEASDVHTSKQPIRYINAETVKLKNSIDRLLEENADLKKVDKTHLEALRAAVDSLLEKYTN